MKLLFNYSKSRCIKSATKISTLPQITTFHFSQQQGQQKSLEFSGSNDDNTITNPILESLAESDTFQTVSPDPSATRRDSRIDVKAWKRQNRKLDYVRNRYSVFAGIHGAKSITELHEQLEAFKTQTQKPQRVYKKQSIIDILDSIAADVDIDCEKQKQTETTHLNEFENENEENEIPFNYKQIVLAYEHAIKQCGFLREFEEGFKIFEDIKKKNDKSMWSGRIYGAVIWLTMEQDFSEKSLHKCFDLLREMQEIMNIDPSPYVYAELIKAATGLRKYNTAGRLVHKIMSDDEIRDIFLKRSRILREVLVNYYAKSMQIENGLKLMNYLKNEYGTECLDDMMYSQMITGCGLAIKNGDTSMLKVAKKLFEQSFNVLVRSPTENVFTSLINCYGFVPDIESCIGVVKSMKDNDDWANPSGYTIAACLKALTQYFRQPLNYEQGWRYVDEILDMMDGKIYNDNGAIYGLLFTLCGGQFCSRSDLEKLYSYYDEMVNNGVNLNPSSANSLLLAGIDHYKFELLNDANNKEEIKQDLIKYIDWALLQFKKYNLSLTKYQSDKLQQRLNEIMQKMNM